MARSGARLAVDRSVPGVPSPDAVFPRSYAEIEAYARRARCPVVATNREASVRRRRPAVGAQFRRAREGPK
ncbi:hypothetical protein [Streptomyces auratus]|uniref:Uncharacterized protein n=1 Tax=Streptomyces auratus AGR0001 TaxID=1160718 RepID=A0A8B1NB29_9ACTN|nr:hypothetical protein SU9_015080 [Streptomyces auratus AGR0001]